MTYHLALAALAEPNRRQIFEAIAANPQSVANVSRDLPISRPAVSQHLKVLADANLVISEKRGTRNIYSANPQGLEALRNYLEQFWGDVLQSFADEVQRQEGNEH